ncbi:MAG: HPr family phosphocarrier protein [Clostridia bacterium]|nr:HPr family phosphocarrier protein [Clostridia bacterium]MBQ5808292.1 HPr family phosphocarrier protein [Clostridia bacterium]
MKTAKIKLNTIEDVRDFVNVVASTDIDIDLSSGRYIVDGKSIMGIFSLDLLNPVTLTAHSDDCDELWAKIEKFIVE